jgi:hypothetical protein
MAMIKKSFAAISRFFANVIKKFFTGMDGTTHFSGELETKVIRKKQK